MTHILTIHRFLQIKHAIFPQNRKILLLFIKLKGRISFKFYKIIQKIYKHFIIIKMILRSMGNNQKFINHV